ncbi:MAG: hypothetical protein U9N59_11280, partial [Campylobacterota bacterium]|nr:hypothetical protein [Campylobacterota bacterium]
FTPVLSTQTVSIGSDTVPISDGLFQTVTKSTSDTIENIWNISLEIDTSVDYSDFHIGIKFFKREDDGSDDIGEFVYRNIGINSGNLIVPDMLVINGIGDSGSGGTYFDSGYDPNGMLTRSIVLDNNILTLKLGLVMKNQTMVKEDTFKVIEDYDIFITSNVPIIVDSKPMNIEIINESKYNFSNSNGIEGRIEIR